MKTVIEPFRIRSVEPIRVPSPEEREAALRRAHYNLFGLRSSEVVIDLLTDSGTGAMSTKQWAAIMTGDEAYAGSESFFDLEKTVRELTGYRHVIPVHQGRAGEWILFHILAAEGKTVPNNTHFDTTRANVEFRGAHAVDLPVDEGLDPSCELRFKGNMDLERLEAFLAEAEPGSIPVGMITITNNAHGGQPVSMENIRETGRLYRKHGIPYLMDAARFAENAYMIKLHEPGYEDHDLHDIAREMFSHADGCMVSAKKDGLVNIGGFVALNNDALAEKAKNLLVLTEGFPTYGGLAGRDMAALNQGLHEVLDEDYLRYRAACAEYMADRLQDMGVPTVRPPGIHAIYVDAGRFLPHIPHTELPAQALCVELYREGGVRAVEIGTLMFGGVDPATGEERVAPLELVRLTFPRRVYTQSHFDWVLECFRDIVKRRDEIRGYRVVKEAPWLRAFTAWMEPVAEPALAGAGVDSTTAEDR